MHKEWKQELDQLKLTDEQKRRMKKVVRQPVKNQKSFVPVILPAFILLAIFAVFIGLPSAPTQQTQTGTAQATPFEMTKPLVAWLVFTHIMINGCYTFVVLNVHKIKRWQHWAPAVKVKRLVTSWHNIWLVLILLAVQGLLWLGLFQASNPLLYVQVYFAIFFVPCMMLLFTFSTRELDLAHCPHCHEPLSKKFLLKANGSFTTEKQCPSCEGSLYKKTTKWQYNYFWLSYPFIMGLNAGGMPIMLVIVIGVMLIGYLIYWVTPYSVQYTAEKEEEEFPPLW